MQYARVGRSGLTVSRLCLGSMYFGGTTPEDEATELMKAALDNGITFWDTSNMYNAGRAEEVMGRGLKSLNARDEVVLETKVFYKMGDAPNDKGLGRRHIIQELDHQLERLQTDWIDIYYLHRADFETPMEETLATMDSLGPVGEDPVLGRQHVPGVADDGGVVALRPTRLGAAGGRAVAVQPAGPPARERADPDAPRIRPRAHDLVVDRGWSAHGQVPGQLAR